MEWLNTTVRLTGKVTVLQEQAMLGKLGAAGWELVTILVYGRIRDYYLKRMKPAAI